jgi:MarR family transcriptional regulator, transcriptional regulator for hemolysin
LPALIICAQTIIIARLLPLRMIVRVPYNERTRMGTQTDIHILGFLLTDGARQLRSAFERRIATAGLGITPGEARTLLNIHALQDCRQLELAARMGIEPMTVCSFLDKLQGLDLIDRQPDASDRRAKRVTLTPASGPMIEALKTEIAAVLAVATAGLSQEQVETFRFALTTLSANLQADAAPAPDQTDIS